MYQTHYRRRSLLQLLAHRHLHLPTPDFLQQRLTAISAPTVFTEELFQTPIIEGVEAPAVSYPDLSGLSNCCLHHSPSWPEDRS